MDKSKDEQSIAKSCFWNYAADLFITFRPIPTSSLIFTTASSRIDKKIMAWSWFFGWFFGWLWQAKNMKKQKSRGSWKIWMHLPMSGDVLSNAEFPRGLRKASATATSANIRKANALKSLYTMLYSYIQLFCRGCGISWLSSAQFSELQSLQLHQELRLSSMHWSFVLCQCGSEQNSAEFSTSQLLISFCNTWLLVKTLAPSEPQNCW